MSEKDRADDLEQIEEEEKKDNKKAFIIIVIFIIALIIAVLSIFGYKWYRDYKADSTYSDITGCRFILMP